MKLANKIAIITGAAGMAGLSFAARSAAKVREAEDELMRLVAGK
ncbi:MAG: hypothetical protein ACLQUZ_03965 [Rhizomicrobium sp.]